MNYLIQQGMPIFEGKKNETVPIKLNTEQKELFLEVAKKLDRPLSYVIRELALRGLANYQHDGELKLTNSEEIIIKAVLGGDIIDLETDKPLFSKAPVRSHKEGFALIGHSDDESPSDIQKIKDHQEKIHSNKQ